MIDDGSISTVIFNVYLVGVGVGVVIGEKRINATVSVGNHGMCPGIHGDCRWFVLMLVLVRHLFGSRNVAFGGAADPINVGDVMVMMMIRIGMVV